MAECGMVVWWVLCAGLDKDLCNGDALGFGILWK